MNPVAGRGGIHGTAAHIRGVFARRGTTAIVETTRPGEEKELTTIAIERGATTIVAVGGDGTCSGVANGIMRSGRACRLAVLPTGTGNDFAKTIGVSGYTPEMIADLVINGTETLIDIGLADGRYFLNSCGFGFDAAVLEASHRLHFLKGNAVYVYAALTNLFSYRGVSVSMNGDTAPSGREMLMITISNGRWLGGVFKIAPRASVLDGKLDVCFFRDAGVVERARLFRAAFRGTHVNMAAVSSAEIQELTLTFAARPSMEIDGELRVAESKSVEISCVPNALSVLAAPGALS
jgi:YegS/Rv2252/BmrU family lipid kinase